MTALTLYERASTTLLMAAPLVFLFLLRMPAPYGRHIRPGWGPTLPGRRAWVLMELPAALAFLAVYLGGRHATEAVPLLFLFLWELHYLDRGLFYPWRMGFEQRREAAVVILSGLAFNLVNASVNALAVSEVHAYTERSLGSPAFALAIALFVIGFATNRWADAHLHALRQEGAGGYRLPRAGLFRWVSCPNYLGEIVEWWGWALATASLAGLAFAVFTTANLVPRALAHHRWYRERFPDYPPRRRAVLPGLL